MDIKVNLLTRHHRMRFERGQRARGCKGILPAMHDAYHYEREGKNNK